MENSTPMLRQYQQIKAQYSDCILFFRLGDFYEMFYEDARTASPILDVVLTARDAGKAGKAPMCGIPFHAAETYIAKLIKAGLKVAICEQVEDPALAKGIVRREVIRVITSGTFIEETSPEARSLAALSFTDKHIGLSLTDTASGRLLTTQEDTEGRIIEMLARYPVYECVYPQGHQDRVKTLFNHPLLRNRTTVLSPFQDWAFNSDMARKSLCGHFHTHSLSGFGIEESPAAIAASAALLEYLKQVHKQPLRHIDRISLLTETDSVLISPAATEGLQLDLLCKTIDHTLTAMGKRRFREWLYHPLKEATEILKRQDAVTALREDTATQQKLQELLRLIPDIEKSVSRISCKTASARDLSSLRSCLANVPQIRQAIAGLKERNGLLSVDDLRDLREFLCASISETIPLSHPEGKIINRGYNAELDTLRDIRENGAAWLKSLQAQEIKRTGINSLKLGFTSVFGYYIEISKANLDRVPQEYIRKQTLVNAERFITPALKEFEEKMLTAEEKIMELEKHLLEQVYSYILDRSQHLHCLADQLATLDCLFGLSMVSRRSGYCAPQITAGLELAIQDGRHPVVEQTITEAFIPNDTLLDGQDNHLIILTGPNMAGKSTYIRQTALLVIMAQMGSYIPAVSARIGIVDKIFTRIGAQDDITKGQSTFMVEMSETAGILNNLSPASLVVLDEIGRGTSTFDGLSLAWAIAEYLARARIRSLFATHFHELTALSEEHPGVKNYNVSVKEYQNEVIFLHKIVSGGTDDSYGIYVAQLAGIPREVVRRAQSILTRLELSDDLQAKIRDHRPAQEQLSLFEKKRDAILQELRDDLARIDINTLTPLEALDKLQELKKKAATHE